MSFILDALKKSESERHRHSGPVLMDVRIAPPRRRLPIWAWVIAGVLLVNLLVLAWVLWLAPDRAPATAAPGNTVVVPAAPSAVAPQAAAMPAPAAPAPQTPAPTAATPPPATTQSPAPALPAPDLSATVPVSPPPPGAATAGTTAPIDTASLPRVQDLIAAGTGLPELRLSLHVYDPVPANRYVLLNGSRLREGEFTSDGVKLLQITPGGAVLEWRGRRMFLGTGG